MAFPDSPLSLQLCEVNDGGPVCSAILSPLSHSTALLTVLKPGITQHEQVLTAETSSAAEASAELPDVVSRVLGVVYDMMEEDGEDRTLAELKAKVFMEPRPYVTFVMMFNVQV